MGQYAGGKEQKSKSTHQAGKSRGFKQAGDQVQMPGKKGKGQFGRVEPSEAPLIHDVDHSVTQEDGSEPARESNI
ncbi:MAG: hypothetical protein A3E78_13770 [Alphaproteobacteria bacterium RIFCSPHIGHO2_12_FULL_63_12]|nr:MAG: hypothetical protein A3E78_13770 [Alphaproteobacteria bacterium RIFCSPHIGHO2_12_FULL_63_12]